MEAIRTDVNIHITGIEKFQDGPLHVQSTECSWRYKAAQWEKNFYNKSC